MSQKVSRVNKKNGSGKDIHVLMAGSHYVNVLKLRILAKITNSEDIPLVLDSVDEVEVGRTKLDVWRVNLDANPAFTFLLDPIDRSKAIILVLKNSKHEEKCRLSFKYLRFFLANTICPILIFINKQEDKEKFYAEDEINNIIESTPNFNQHYKRPVRIQQCCARKYEQELLEGFEWLANEKTIQKSAKQKNNGKKEQKLGVPVLMAGVDSLGMSTILQKMTKKKALIAEEKVKLDNINYKVSIMSGKPDAAKLEDNFLKDIDALIYVIDGKVFPDYSVFISSLQTFLETKQLVNRPLLVFYNPIDNETVKDRRQHLPKDHLKALIPNTLSKELEWRNNNYHIEDCDEGILPGFRMLKTLLENSQQQKTEVK